MFKDTPDDRGLFDEEDDLHLPSALGTLQGVNIPDFLEKYCPQLSPVP